MPTDDTLSGSQQPTVPLTTASNAPVRSKHSLFALPAPVKRIFDQFPLREYAANTLPARAPTERETHRLHVFAREEDLKQGGPSFNPACLKWQTFLRFSGVHFTLVSSNNHASPSGSLPFLEPATSKNSSSAPDPVPANKLRKWLAAQQKGNTPHQTTEATDVRLEAYQSLVDDRIRKFWLYQLYLAPQNDALMQRLYITPCSNHSLVRFALTRHLRSAAEEELVKSAGTNVVDAEVLMREAGEAFEALSTLLGEQEWFFGSEKPGLFDASVFAFTHLILSEQMDWAHNPLKESLTRYDNLMRHQKMVLEIFYQDEGVDAEQERKESFDVQRPMLHTRTTSTLGKRKTLNLRA